MYHRLTHACNSVEQIEWEMVLGRFLSLYPSDVADYVRLRKPEIEGSWLASVENTRKPASASTGPPITSPAIGSRGKSGIIYDGSETIKVGLRQCLEGEQGLP